MTPDTASPTSAERSIRDGFPGQRMLVTVRSRLREFLQRRGTTHLAVSDCGYFPHAHRHGVDRPNGVAEAIVIVCIDGSGWCRTPAGIFPVETGQVIVLPPRVAHAYGSDPADPWSLYWCHIAGPEVTELFSSSGFTADAPVRNVEDTYNVVGLLQEILTWTERDSSTASMMAAAGAAWHLIAVLAAARTTRDVGREAISRAAAYLQQNLAESISVAELAGLANLSTSHFADRFRAHTGTSVLKYQKLLRMARARELLDTTSRPVAVIAHDVGYSDAFYFARQFKTVHGVTPREYRNRTY